MQGSSTWGWGQEEAPQSAAGAPASMSVSDGRAVCSHQQRQQLQQQTKRLDLRAESPCCSRVGATSRNSEIFSEKLLFLLYSVLSEPSCHSTR